jgi:hypothetical protein
VEVWKYKNHNNATNLEKEVKMAVLIFTFSSSKMPV